MPSSLCGPSGRGAVSTGSAVSTRNSAPPKLLDRLSDCVWANRRPHNRDQSPLALRRTTDQAKLMHISWMGGSHMKANRVYTTRFLYIPLGESPCDRCGSSPYQCVDVVSILSLCSYHRRSLRSRSTCKGGTPATNKGGPASYENIRSNELSIFGYADCLLLITLIGVGSHPA
jgi:hypothetical protein